MPKLAANLSFLFQELPFADRFAAAADCGFRGVEFLSPYEHPAERVAAAAQAAGVEIVLFNAGIGDWPAGERGLAALPGREADFRREAERAFDYAGVLSAGMLHVMAGIEPAGTDAGGRAAMARTFIDNLRWAADRAPAGVVLTVEPINQRDMPGYFLRDSAQACAALDDAGRPNLRLQFDFYHTQISEGDVGRRLERLLPRIAHTQIAGAPGRHEPDVGELNGLWLLERLDALGYGGWVGCEYRPATDTRAGLGWAADYGLRG